MPQSSIDAEPEAAVAAGKNAPRGATIVMNPPAGVPEEKSAQSARAELLSETLAMAGDVLAKEADADEPTIEEYMAALLARSKQSSTSAQPVVFQPAARPPEERRKTVPATTTPVQPSGPPALPECRDAISEMRELANISARSSFNIHRGRQLVLDMHGKRFVAVFSMLASLALLSLSASVRSPAYLAAVAAVTAGSVWSLKYLSLGRELAKLCNEADLNDRIEDQ